METLLNIYISFTDISFDPIALRIGPLSITWYALSYIAGLLFAWRYAIFISRKFYSISTEVIDSFFNNTIIGVIIGGRLGYVFLYNFSYYSENFLEIFYIWKGGMSFHGGLLGVIIAQIITSKKFKVHFFIITDITSITVPFGFMLGRIANFINGELYGRVTDHPLGIIFPNGGPLPRHPSQLYEALFEGFILLLVLNILFYFSNLKLKPGIITGIFIFLYGFFRFLIEFAREPDPQIGFLIFNLTLGQLLCFLMIVIGIVTIYISYYNYQFRSNNA